MKKNLNAKQKKQLQEFRGIVGNGMPENVAVEILNNSKWDINGAANIYFTDGYSEKYPAHFSNSNSSSGGGSVNQD